MNIVSVLFNLKAKLHQLGQSHLSLLKRVDKLERNMNDLNAAIAALQTASAAIIAKLNDLKSTSGVPLADVEAAATQINTIAQQLTAATQPTATP